MASTPDQRFAVRDDWLAVRASRPPWIEDPELLKLAREKAVKVVGFAPSPWFQDVLLGWLLPLGMLALLWWGGMRRMGGR